MRCVVGVNLGSKQLLWVDIGAGDLQGRCGLQSREIGLTLLD